MEIVHTVRGRVEIVHAVREIVHAAWDVEIGHAVRGRVGTVLKYYLLELVVRMVLVV